MMRRAGLVLLALAIAAHYAWNAWTVTPLTGYDAPGHAAYVYGILEEGRLPDPYQGWSTFHPPLYYLLGAAVWRLAEPFAPDLGSLRRGGGPGPGPRGPGPGGRPPRQTPPSGTGGPGGAALCMRSIDRSRALS